MLFTTLTLALLQQEPNRGGTVDLASQDPDVAIQSFTLPEGYAIELVASERDFPDLANPVSLAWDGSGRLLVACMPSYPMVDPGDPSDDYVLALVDEDADGVMDRSWRFVDGLTCPTGLEVGHGGLYVVSQPDLLHVRDTDGDGVADERSVPLPSFSTTDTHHAMSAFGWSPDGGLLFAEGVFHTSQIETPHGVVRNKDAAVFRWEPRRARLEVHADYHFMNPWGQVFDAVGRWYIADASGGANLYGTQLTGRVEWPGRHRGIGSFTTIVRPTAGAELVETRAFAPEDQGDFLVANCIGFRGIKQHRVIHEGAGVSSEERRDLLSSSDPNFRPVDLRFGPDGALYIVDWFNPLIGHMQYSLFDDRRDRGHGRIWRIRYEGGQTVAPVVEVELSTQALLARLNEPESRSRYRARRELWARDPETTAAAASEFGLGNGDHLALEALWVQCGLHAVDTALLDQCSESMAPMIRAAAVKALRYAYPEPVDVLARLERAVNDEHPAVRLEAVAALTWRDEPAAAAIAMQAVDSSLEDETLAYVFDEALEVLREPLLDDLAAGVDRGLSPEALGVLFASVDTDTLLELPGSEARERSLLRRADAPVEARLSALERLSSDASFDRTFEIAALFLALDDADDYASLEELVPLLIGDARRLTEDAETMSAFRRHRLDRVRRLGWQLSIASSSSPDDLLVMASTSRARLRDLLHAVADRGQRDDAWVAPVAALLEARDESAPPTMARRLRLTIPGDDRIMNISEVEVFAGEANVALKGRASSSSVDWDGPPEAGVDGHITGNFAPNQMVHTRPESNPWFEVEWNDPAEVTSIRVWNRTQKPYDQRLDGFELVLFDEDGAEVWRRDRIDAPEEMGEYEVELDSGGVPREAAVRALSVVGPAALDAGQLLTWLDDGGPALARASERALADMPPVLLEGLDLSPLASRFATSLREATWDDRFDPEFQSRLDAARALDASVSSDEAAFTELSAALAAEASMPSLARFESGREHYVTHCSACHQPNGKGISGAYPPLSGSAWMTGDVRRPIRIALHGLQGDIVVEGESYRGAMAPLGALLDDQALADLLTYTRNAWGNAGSAVDPSDVANERAAAGQRRTPWKADELDSDLGAP